MKQYAKELGNALVFAQDAEFAGIPKWRTNEPAVRSAGYLPAQGDAEQRDGYAAKPKAWHVVERNETRLEPRQYVVDDYEDVPDPEHEGQTIRTKTGSHTEWRDTEITLDASYIQIDEWQYDAIPAPEPPPLRRQFSKGELLEALQALGLYDAAKAIYINDIDLQIAFAGFADIDMDYPVTGAIMQKYPDFFTEGNVAKLQRYITFGNTEAEE